MAGSTLRQLFSEQEIKDMLKNAKLALHQISTTGGVTQVRTRDRNTSFGPANVEALRAWISELEAALGIKRVQSRPVYF